MGQVFHIKWCTRVSWERQKEIDNLSKKMIRETPEGGKRHQESMRKVRETPERKGKQKEIDHLSKKKIRETPEGKEKQKEIDNLSKKKIRETPEGRKKQKEIDNLSISFCFSFPSGVSLIFFF